MEAQIGAPATAPHPPSSPLIEGVDNELRGRLGAELDQVNAEINELEARMRERLLKREALSTAVNIMDESTSKQAATQPPGVL